MLWRNLKPRVRSRAALPEFINPCLPTKVKEAPQGSRWAHEIKHDGFRLQIHCGAGSARLYTMTGLDWTERYPRIARAAAALGRRAIIDAEAVIQDGDGVTDFQALWGGTRNGEAFAFAFDVMMLDGVDVRGQPWIVRRELLGKHLKPHAGIVLNDHRIGDGPKLYAEACRMGLEGIVSKRIDAPYRSGRVKNWVKVKNPDAPAVLRFRENHVA